MTAPKLIWVNECDYTQCTPHDAITGICYIRADVPELAALVDEMKTFCHRVEIGEVRSKRSYAAFKAALSAYEAME